MSLRSIRFRHNDRLVNASYNAPPLRQGEKGHPVRLVQQALEDVGFPLPISTAKGSPDGIFGSETKSKVRKFQEKHHLDVDGDVGTQTMGKLDELLFGKPAKDLPDIPGPGGAKNIAENAQAVIREVLASRLLTSINFSLEYEQKERLPDYEDDTPNPVVATHSARFNGHDYLTVAEAVADGLIVVQTGASAHTAAQYVPNNLVKGFKADTIMIGKELHAWNPVDCSLIVHEGAHAVCDVRNIGRINFIFSEMIAYIAEAYYRQLAGLGPKKTGGSGRIVYHSADIAVKSLRKHTAPPTHIMDDLWFGIVAEHPFYVSSGVEYNGIPT